MSDSKSVSVSAPATATAAAVPATAAAVNTNAAVAAGAAVFETGKEAYDEDVRRAVLGYDDLSLACVSAIGAHSTGTATNVLCVGCGTGQEVLAVARTVRPAGAPELRVTGLDPAAAMIGAARRRVDATLTAEQRARVTLLHGFAHDLSASGALAPASFDAATSMLVMHLVPDVDDVNAAMAADRTAGSSKLAYLQSIAACLKPNARLFLVDGCGDTTTSAGNAELHGLMDVWVEFVRARGASDTMLSTLKANALKWGKVVPKQRVVQLLRAAGFVDVKRVYNAFHMNGFVARYAGAPAPAPTTSAAASAPLATSTAVTTAAAK